MDAIIKSINTKHKLWREDRFRIVFLTENNEHIYVLLDKSQSEYSKSVNKIFCCSFTVPYDDKTVAMSSGRVFYFNKFSRKELNEEINKSGHLPCPYNLLLSQEEEDMINNFLEQIK